MGALTSRERFARMYEHKLADRVPILDSAWAGTLRRWRREGMPEGVDWIEYFDLDRVGEFKLDNTPRYPARTVEETEDHIVFTTEWGATLKKFKQEDSSPEFVDFTIVDPDSWKKAKARMTPCEDRIPWEMLGREYPRWREAGAWVVGQLWFGFDVTHSWAVGTERLLMALVEDPEWVVDMFNTYLDLNLTLMDRAWEAGYTCDEVFWYDDMGYKQNQFFSVGMYRELLKPVHKRAIEWAHNRGIKARLHSCGDINPLVPELLDIGLDGLNPLEVKAGMDPVGLKQAYGDKLLFHGGINAVLWPELESIEAEMRRVVPVMKENGGYIFASDHSIPNMVSLENFRRIISLAKELGSY